MVDAPGIVSGKFEINRERHPARKDEAARDGGLLLAEDGYAAGARSLGLGRIDKCLEDLAEGLSTGGATAEHQDSVGRERPAGIFRGDAETQAGKFGMARREFPTRKLDIVRVRGVGEKCFVLHAQARKRVVVRKRDGGHGRRFGADQHGAVGHGRPPVITIADIQLCPVKSHAEIRPGRRRPGLIGVTAHIEEDVVARLEVCRARNLKGTLRRFTVLVGQHGLGRTVRDGSLDAGKLNGGVLHVTLEPAADAIAQHRIDLAGFRQCIQYQGRRDRSGHDGLATQNENAFDLALELRIQIDRQIGRYAPCIRVRLQYS